MVGAGKRGYWWARVKEWKENGKNYYSLPPLAYRLPTIIPALATLSLHTFCLLFALFLWRGKK